MNNKILDYLNANKGKFPANILKEELIKSGYKENDIKEVFDFVYGEADSAPVLAGKKFAYWYNIFAKKEYSTSADKVIDFIVGALLPWVIGFGLHIIDDDMLEDYLWFPMSIYIAFMIFTFKPRRYIFRGLYFNLSVIGGIVVAGIMYFVIFKPRLF